MPGVARAIRVRGHDDGQREIGNDIDHLGAITSGEADGMAADIRQEPAVAVILPLHGATVGGFQLFSTHPAARIRLPSTVTSSR
jgi:hypothetical protein